MTKGNGSIGDDKSTQVAIGEADGKVVMAFDRQITKLVLDPENARQIGEGLARAAYSLRYGAPPPDMRSAIKEHTRNTLINRFVIVDRSLREQGRNPAYIAQTLVDLFLSEVS